MLAIALLTLLGSLAFSKRLTPQLSGNFRGKRIGMSFAAQMDLLGVYPPQHRVLHFNFTEVIHKLYLHRHPPSGNFVLCEWRRRNIPRQFDDLRSGEVPIM